MMIRSSRVGDLMSTALVCVRDTDTIATAEREMLRAGIRHLPVVDEHHNLIGIISSRDVPGRSKDTSSKQRVGNLMSRTVVTVGPETSGLRGMDLMTEHGFHSLPVVASDGHLLGIVTDTDLLSGSRASSGLTTATVP
jgi:CBS domain-containing protein